MKIRYIRDHEDTNSLNPWKHWLEIQAYDYTGANVALGKTVTHNGISDAVGTPSLVTDGIVENPEIYFGPHSEGPMYLQVDLGAIIDVEKVAVWHYPDGRTYYNTKTEVSKDGTTWTTIFDSNVDGEYAETLAGRTSFLPEEPPEETIIIDDAKIRYIRDWLEGNTINGDKHWIEIQAYNFQGENVALGKPVTFNAEFSGKGTSDLVTNGIYNNGEDYFNPQLLDPIYVEIDLGELVKVEKITVWHYYNDGRQYVGNKTQISKDGANWATIFDSDIDGQYVETINGRTSFLPFEEPLTEVLPWEDMRFAILLNTGFFETSRYTLDEQMFITSGNWDDAGMSAGNLQYNWGTADRLTELWNYMLLNHEQVVKDCFGSETAKYTQFRDVCLNKTRAQKIAFGETITNYDPPLYGHGLIEPWRTILGTLLQTAECQAKYAEMMDKYYLPDSLDLFKQFNVTSRASLASLFDLSVNRGRFYPCNTVQVDFDIIDADITLTSLQKEAQKIYQINVRGNDRTNATAGDTHTMYIPRRMAQANQGGDYQGSLYDPEVQFNITQDPAIVEKLMLDTLGVKIGEIDVQNVFYGTTPITKLYLGAELLGGKTEPYYTAKVPQTQFRTAENSYLGIGDVTSINLEINQFMWVDVQNWVACRTYYTTDGSTPTTDSALYYEQLKFTQSCTLKTLTVSVNGIAEPVKTLQVNVAQASVTYINPSEPIQANIPITVSFINDQDKAVWYRIGDASIDYKYTSPFQVNQTDAGGPLIKITYWAEGEPENSITYDTTASQPESPVLTAYGDVGKVDLAWNAVPNATSYTVHRSTVQGQLGPILAGTQWMTLLGWTDLTGEPDVTYYYTIRATNYAQGASSNQVGATALSGSPAETGWRYIRFQGYGDQTGGTTRIVEVEAVEGTTNLLRDKLPISGETPNGGNIAVATNGVYAHSSGYPFWWVGAGVPNLVYDLGAKKDLNYIRYVAYSPSWDLRQAKFKIYLSNDNVQWTLLVDRSTSTTPSPHEGFAYAVDI